MESTTASASLAREGTRMPVSRSVQRLKTQAQELLAFADIQIDGSRPWDIQVHDNRLYARVFAQRSLGLGEAYMDGWWDTQELDSFFTRVFSANLPEKIGLNWHLLLLGLQARLMNRQTTARAFQVGQRHYDIGNDLYQTMLDDTMTYSCGYWNGATTLAQAQERKLDLICRKIGLQSGQSVLDIGCGWGGFAKFAAERYGATVVGITVSREQQKLAAERCRGLPVEIRLQDYRSVSESFDHIISVGMFEHVGPKNYRTFMEMAARCLKEEGLFLLHTIGFSLPFKSYDPWLDRYIFSNSMLPAASQIASAFEGIFVMEDWHNFSAYYDKTLMAWFQNIERGWDSLASKYDGRFRRMWTYYLLCSAGLFRSRSAQLWQIVLSKHGVPGGYESLR